MLFWCGGMFTFYALQFHSNLHSSLSFSIVSFITAFFCMVFQDLNSAFLTILCLTCGAVAILVVPLIWMILERLKGGAPIPTFAEEENTVADNSDRRWLLSSERMEIRPSLLARLMSLLGQGREDDRDQMGVWISPQYCDDQWIVRYVATVTPCGRRIPVEILTCIPSSVIYLFLSVSFTIYAFEFLQTIACNMCKQELLYHSDLTSPCWGLKWPPYKGSVAPRSAGLVLCLQVQSIFRAFDMNSLKCWFLVDSCTKQSKIIS